MHLSGMILADARRHACADVATATTHAIRTATTRPMPWPAAPISKGQFGISRRAIPKRAYQPSKPARQQRHPRFLCARALLGVEIALAVGTTDRLHVPGPHAGRPALPAQFPLPSPCAAVCAHSAHDLGCDPAVGPADPVQRALERPLPPIQRGAVEARRKLSPVSWALSTNSFRLFFKIHRVVSQMYSKITRSTLS